MRNGVFIIGMCGRSGCGKGYVCKKFAIRGIPSIDTDAVYRDIVAIRNGTPGECLSELVREFGTAILDDDGALDRRALSAVVFAPGAEDRLSALNSITHKYILCETLRRISLFGEHGARAVIIDAPVLFESGFDSLCDKTLCICAPQELSVRRICERDGITALMAERRLANQTTEAELVGRCDDVIVNDDVAEVLPQVDGIISKYNLKGSS